MVDTTRRRSLPSRSTMGTSIGMIAHDFTGALDSLAAFVEAPGDTVVFLVPGETADNARNIAIVTATQTASPATAYTRVRDAARELTGRHIFKRVGSTLRGNIGPEVRAVIDETGTTALVCSALPREGRTVVDGIGRLNSVPLHLTEYGRDPTVPCRESSIPAILREAKIAVSCVPLHTVRDGVEALHQTLRATTSEAVVVDAETDDDMRTIAWALAALGTDWCACASSGLSPHLAKALGRRTTAMQSTRPRFADSGVLAVIGSTSTVSATQVARLDELEKVTVIRIEAPALCTESPEVAHWVDKALGVLANGHSAVLTTSLSSVVPYLIDQVAPRLGSLAARVVQRGCTSALVLSGGQTALNTCNELGISSVEVQAEIEPGAVHSHGTDGEGIDRKIVSKAGGFGDSEMLVRLLERIR